MSIQIEEGRRGITRNGVAVGPLVLIQPEEGLHSDWVWRNPEPYGCYFWTRDGKVGHAPDDRDIVEIVPFCELGTHRRGPGDICKTCGATREQVDEQARAAMCGASHAAAEQREQMGHGFGEPVSDAPLDPISMFVAGTSHLAGAEALTEERKSTHGNWTDQAVVGVMLDQAVQDSTGYANLAAYQRKAVDMILVKVSRIVSGDPSHADHWDDIAGYAHLGKGGHNPA